jgi:hypothetical protein
MQNFLANVGGLLNRLKGGANQLSLGALMYGSSQAQQGLKNMFGMPTTGDYIRQWEAQRTTPMQRAKVGQPMVLGGRLGYKSAVWLLATKRRHGVRKYPSIPPWFTPSR